MLNNLDDILRLVERNATFYVSHSGGKDSQAMYILLSEHVPAHQIVVVHADLGQIEWHGTQDHIRATTDHQVNVVRASKTFFDMVRHRHATRPDAPSWPSAKHRQCTSDLKRNPIYKFIRNDMKARGCTLAVNCMGLRAEESSARAKRVPFSLNRTLSKAGREVFELSPIHNLTTEQVFAAINMVGQTPHPAYETGNERLSCVFCIMGSANDLANGRRQRPELFQQYVTLERETGYTFLHGQSLEEKANTGD